MNIDRRLWNETQGVRIECAIAIALSLIASLLLLLQIYCLSSIITRVVLTEQSLLQVGLLLSTWLGAIIMRMLVCWGRQIMAHHVAFHVKGQLRQRICAHLAASEPVATNGRRAEEIARTLVDDLEMLDPYYSLCLPQICMAILLPLVVLIVIGSLDLFSDLILLLTAPIFLVLSFLIGGAARMRSQRRRALLTLTGTHFLDMLAGLTTLKLFGDMHRHGEAIRLMAERFRLLTMQVVRTNLLTGFVLELGVALSIVLVTAEISLRVLSGQMVFAMALFVFLLTLAFYEPLRGLGTTYQVGWTSREAAQRIFALLDTPIPDHSSQTLPELFILEGVISFEHVSFSYGDKHPALHDISFRLAPGQKLALVGPDGAGKGTIAQLLLGFIEPMDGEIKVAGVPLGGVDMRAWRGALSWVPQRPFLFHATVTDNIRLGAPYARLPDVVEAAYQAQAHEFIQMLPYGYDTVIGECGVHLSESQICCLSLARAFLRNTPLLVLDDVTAQLDPGQEALILAAIGRLMRGRTVLAITRRLQIVQRVDQIIVLDGGRIVEIGTHQSLIQRPGLYRQLVFASEGGNL